MPPGRVLVVEDDDLVRSLAVESLLDEGFEVVEAADGDIALKHLEGHARFNVLLTDVRMPSRLDGIDLVVHARRLEPDISVIVVSGYAPHLKDRLETLDPPVMFLSKPYRSAEIVAAVRCLLP